MKPHTRDPSAVTAAVEAVRSGSMSYRMAAKSFGVGKTTLVREIEGTRSRGPVGHPIQLPELVEAEISTALEALAAHGLFILSSDLPVLASTIVGVHGIPDFSPGRKWVKQFLRRHPNLHLRTPRAVSSRRGEVLNAKTVNTFFDMLDKEVVQKEFGGVMPEPHRVWNVDETNVLSHREHYFGDKVVCSGASRGLAWAGAKRESWTVVVAISASGETAPPLIVGEGVHFMEKWLDGVDPSPNPRDEFLVAVTPSSVVDGPLFLEWLKRFSASIPVSTVRPILLFLDNCASHLTLAAMEYAHSQNIVVVGIPSCASALLQPLDVGVFKDFKACWRKLKARYCAV
jgi:hypothetical protein